MSLNPEGHVWNNIEKLKIRIKEHLNTNSKQFHSLYVSESSEASTFRFFVQAR